MPVSHSMFDLVLSALVKAGDLDGAEECWALMEKTNIPPAVATYACMIHAYARTGDDEVAFDWWQKMGAERRLNVTKADLQSLYHKLLRGVVQSSSSHAHCLVWVDRMKAGLADQRGEILIPEYPTGNAHRAVATVLVEMVRLFLVCAIVLCLWASASDSAIVCADSIALHRGGSCMRTVSLARIVPP